MNETNGIRELQVLELFKRLSSSEDVAALQAGFNLSWSGMTQHSLARPQNAAMLGLLKQNCPIDLGMPAYLLDAYLADDESSYTIETLVGPCEESLIVAYRGMKGYQFSWGTLIQQEIHYQFEDEMKFTTYSLSVELVLRPFPRVDIWDYLVEIYCTGNFEVSPDNETTLEASMLDISSDLHDGSDKAAFRLWMAEQFLPRHFPQLLRYLCLWLYIHDHFPATFDKMWDVVRTETYMDTVMEERNQPGVIVH